MPEAPHRLSDAPLLCELLDRPVPIELSTVSPSGRPQSSVVWCERRGDDLVMFFERTSAKVRNLEQNPHVAILVVDHERLLRPGVPVYAQLTGKAVLLPEEPGFLDTLARSYGWADGWTLPRSECNTVVVTATRITGYGPVDGNPMSGWGRDTA